MRFRQFSALVALSLSSLCLAEVFDLSELKWALKNQNGSIHIPATIPSQAHLDLFKAGIITEPLLGINGAFHSAFAIGEISILNARAGAMQITRSGGSYPTTGRIPRISRP